MKSSSARSWMYACASLAACCASWSASAQPACREWRARAPSPRYGAAAVFDAARGMCVVFGGYTGVGSTGSVAETWLWNGADWTLATIEGPAVRDYAAMCYDRDRQVIVMFGGTGSNGGLRDTWEWDGARWTLRTLAGPAARSNHAMAYDAARHVTVMCGGGSGGGTWEWNGSVWMLRSLAGPSNKSSPRMVYDEVRQRVILFGGTPNGSETWEWDGGQGTWTLLTTRGPAARTRHVMAYDTLRGVAEMHGGLSSPPPSTYLNDTWEWRSLQGVWQQTDAGTIGPSLRSDAAMTYDAVRQEIVFFGGQGNSARNGDLWTLPDSQPSQWHETAPYPNTTSGGILAYDSWRGVTVAYVASSNGNKGQTWEWNGHRWKWRTNDGPPARQGARMAFDSLRGVVVLFGGGALNGSGPYGDTWEFDGEAWQQVSQAGPSPRWDHAMAFDESRGVTVLYGGTTDNVSSFSDTWQWNGQHWTPLLVTGPGPRRKCGMTYDRQRHVVLLYGGAANVSLWSLNGEQWTSQFMPSPPPNGACAMGYDEERDATMLAGPTGLYNSSIAPWWEWMASHWSAYDVVGTFFGDSNSMAYDRARRRMVLFGGSDRAQIWEFAHAAACAGDVNGDGTVDVNDLLIVLTTWGPCPPTPCQGDVNDDGVVNVSDLLTVIGAWG